MLIGFKSDGARRQRRHFSVDLGQADIGFIGQVASIAILLADAYSWENLHDGRSGASLSTLIPSRLAWADDTGPELLQPHWPTVTRKPSRTPGVIKSGELQSSTSLPGSGALFPLERTDVTVDISAFLARTTVTQTFGNPFLDPVEAVYRFPLSHTGAVDALTMQIGPRTIRGEIKRRAEAREIYEAARESGATAALLDQERPNIFTQSVANVPPREKVRIVISYVETISYEAGRYEYVFPMVIGPRYIPAGT
ncbi:MAG: VIT domain-containing protein [Sphingomonadaceae bacterium]